MAIRDVLFDVAGEFYTTDPTELERIDRFITRAQCQVSYSAFGCNYELAVAYVAAHMLKLAELASTGSTLGGGRVSAEKVGDLSRSYQYAGTKDFEWGATTYGLEYLRLRRMAVRTPAVITGTFTGSTEGSCN